MCLQILAFDVGDRNIVYYNALLESLFAVILVLPVLATPSYLALLSFFSESCGFDTRSSLYTVGKNSMVQMMWILVKTAIGYCFTFLPKQIFSRVASSSVSTRMAMSAIKIIHERVVML